MGIISWLFGGARRTKEHREPPRENLPGGQIKAYHLARFPIPDGHRIYFERLAMGIHSTNRKACAAFCRGRNPRLRIEPEPSNSHDPNALKLIGEWDGVVGSKAKMIGYVPREVARVVGAARVADAIQPRLLKTYVGSDDFVEVLFQITGPKDRYKDLVAAKVAS